MEKSKSQSDEKLDLNSLKDRMQRSMTVIFNKESENVEKNLTFLSHSRINRSIYWFIRYSLGNNE